MKKQLKSGYCLDNGDKIMYADQRRHGRSYSAKFRPGCFPQNENPGAFFFSGAPERSTISIGKGTTWMYRNRKPCISFFMVNMASGMYRGRMCPTKNDVAHNMAALLKLIPSHAALVYSVHL